MRRNKMKKVFKIFLLTLALALICSCFGILTVSSSAEKTPTAGYAVWADEEEYLKNPDNPLIVSSSKELSLAIGSNKFVLCYGDVTLMSGITVTNGSELIIDLNGYTLTATSSITVGANAGYIPTEFTFRNGTVIHQSGQFIKPQPNSRVYFDNVTVYEKASSFFYADGVRLIYFKDSKVIFEKAEKAGNSFQIYPLLETYVSKIASLEGVKADDLVYEQSIVFDNTQLIDDGTEGKIISIPARSDCVPAYSITFMNGAGFNTLDSSFISNLNVYDGMRVSLNIIKGAAFAGPEVPIVEDEIDETVEISYYNKAEFDGCKIIPTDETSLLLPGEEQIEGQNPKLIFGNSAKVDAPYMLCNYLCDVTWIVNGEEERVEGYADGLTLENKKESGGYYFKTDSEGERGVYINVHSGWSCTDGGEPLRSVTLTERDNTFYAVFTEEGPAVLVEFSSPEMLEGEILGGYMDSQLASSAFDGVESGSYLYLFADASLDISDGIALPSGVTLDLGGHTLERFDSLSSSRAVFNVSSGAFTLKNGTFRTALIGIAEVSRDAEITVEDVNILFGSYPAFTVKGGSLTVLNSAAESRSADGNVPFALFSETSGEADVSLERTNIDVSGPLLAYKPSVIEADISVEIVNCTSLFAASLLEVYPEAAGIENNTELFIAYSASSLECERVFDIPVGAPPSAELTLYFEDGSISEDPREADCVSILTDEGKRIVGTGTVYTVVEGGFSMKYSMTIAEDFTAEFYLSESSDFISVSYFGGEAPKEKLEKRSIGGEEYRVLRVTGISPSDAAEAIKIIVKFNSSGEVYLADLTYSPLDYFAELIEGGDVLSAKLSAAALRYIFTAYEYTDSYVSEKFEAILSSEKYLSLLRDRSEIAERHSEMDIGNISEVFTGAQLYLSSSLYMKFNIREGYTGDITVADTGYTVTDGRVGESDCILVPFSAYGFYRSGISISGDGGIYGEYSLASYIGSLGGKDDELSLMLEALYSFCYEAHVYDAGGVIPPYIEHTPTVDVEHRFP